MSELFDEVRSAATVIDDNAMSLQGVQSRAENLIPAILEKINHHEQFETDLKHLAEELTNTSLQLHQTQKELEHYYLKERETSAFFEKYIEQIGQKPVLKLARLVRLSENSK